MLHTTDDMTKNMCLFISDNMQACTTERLKMSPSITFLRQLEKYPISFRGLAVKGV